MVRGMVTKWPIGRMQRKKGSGFSLPPPPHPSAKRKVIFRRLSLVRHAARVSILALTRTSCVISGE